MDPDQLAQLHADARQAEQEARTAYRTLYQAVAQALDEGHSATVIARTLGVHRTFVYDMRDRGRSWGDTSP